MRRRNSPDWAPWMMRWSYVLVSVTTLLTARRESVSWEAPWNSAGYSMAPTPTIVPWPGMSRGTEWTVPIPPGLVSETVTPAKSSTVSLFARARRTMSPPGRGDAHDHARGLEARRIRQQLQCFGGRPAERVIDLAALDHRLQPRTLGARPLDRHEQRQQARLVGGAGVLAERAAERQMQRPRPGRQVGRVGRQKGERRLVVAAILREVEMDAADQMPRRVLPLQERLDGHLGCDAFRAEGCGGLFPQRLQDGGGDVLDAGHRRRRGGQCFEVLGRRRRDGRVGTGLVRMRAECRDEPRGEVAPVAEIGGKRGPDFGGATLAR